MCDLLERLCDVVLALGRDLEERNAVRRSEGGAFLLGDCPVGKVTLVAHQNLVDMRISILHSGVFSGALRSMWQRSSSALQRDWLSAARSTQATFLTLVISFIHVPTALKLSRSVTSYTSMMPVQITFGAGSFQAKWVMRNLPGDAHNGSACREEERTLSTAEIRSRNSLETLLASSVPDLQTNNP